MRSCHEDGLRCRCHARSAAATFPTVPGTGSMKTFLKVVLVVLLAVVALKLLPFAFALGCALAATVAGLVIVGVSTVFGLLVAAVVLAAVLSPIWIPAMLVVGLIALIRRSNRRTAPVSV